MGVKYNAIGLFVVESFEQMVGIEQTDERSSSIKLEA